MLKKVGKWKVVSVIALVAGGVISLIGDWADKKEQETIAADTARETVVELMNKKEES